MTAITAAMIQGRFLRPLGATVAAPAAVAPVAAAAAALESAPASAAAAAAETDPTPASSIH
jgi:hypothetical protein